MRNQSSKAAYVQASAVIALTLMSPRLAIAACEQSGTLKICQPTITSINSPGPTSIQVHWLTSGGVGPNKATLVKAGSAARQYADGYVLDSSPASSSPVGLPGGALTLSVPSGGVTITNLHVVAYWGNVGLASAGFNATSSTPPTPAPVALAITSEAYNPPAINVAWGGGQGEDFYNISWTVSGLTSFGTTQREVDQAGPPASYNIRTEVPGTYNIRVEGCKKQWGISSSSYCRGWSAVRSITIPPISSNASPNRKVFTLKDDIKGDCVLQHPVITITPDGKVQFSAIVRTDKTSSSDYWHMNVYPQAGGQNVPYNDSVLAFKWKSEALHREHHEYTWQTQDSFVSAIYPLIDGFSTTNAC